ncbi:MAG: hypothetical protein P4M08_12745 [Oligoflexia bacterium]|nr:hypothetical protein [Oligoflexia bacterium]
MKFSLASNIESRHVLRVAGIAIGVALSVFAGTACMPVEQALPIPSPTPAASAIPPEYAGFTGLVSANTTGATKVKLSWYQSNDPKVVAYNIYDVTNRFSPKLVKTVSVPASFTTITSPTVANETLYVFRARAADAQNNEDSNTVDLSAIPYGGVTGATVQTSTSALITFNDGSNADQVNVYCSTDGGQTYVLMSALPNYTQTSTTLTGLTSGTTYTCRVALQIGNFVDNNTNTVTFTPIGQATQLVFDTEPGGAIAGIPLGPQPVVKIFDTNNNLVTAGPDANATITLSISTASPSGAAGTVVGTLTATKGVATFSNITFNTAGNFILTATKNDTSSMTYGSGPLTADSTQFTVTPGPVSPAFSTISTSVTAPAVAPLVANGTAAYNVNITLADQFGNVITGVKPQFASTVAADTTSQPTSATNASGQTSGNLSSTVAGTRTISISSPAGLTSVTSSVVFVPGPATKVGFNQQPVTSPAGPAGLNNFQVAIEDAQGNIVTSSTATVTVSIFVNPGGGALSGTASAAAVNGIATFTGLGINHTGTGYKLVANSTGLTVAYSNAFNITSGVPAKIGVTGPATVVSGSCSTAITIQLQDFAGNPANATANTPVNVTGLGSGALYTSSSCAGTASSNTITFTTGSNTKTFYLKDNAAEALTMTVTDPASVMSSGSLAIAATPDQIALGGPATVVAGKCSSAFSIVTAGNNGNPGPVAANTTVDITGISGSHASLFTDSACTTSVSATNVTLAAGTSSTNIYLKDSTSESLTLAVLDPASIMTTTSASLNVTITPSNINFTGPTTVVSGTCGASTAYTVQLQDAAGNAVVSSASATTLTMNGLGGTQGVFYTSSSCTGAAIGTTVTIPMNSSSVTLYFRDNAAETLHLYVSDPANNMANSQTITVGVSPSALQITGPSPASAKTNVCAGPFTVNTMDGSGNIDAAITPITVNLSGAGSSASFYSDSACSNTATSLNFTSGVSAKTFYLMGLYPASNLVLTATDAASVLSSGTMNFAITAAPGFVGTQNGSLQWFQTGVTPVAARIDGPQGVRGLHFDSTHTYLYVADLSGQRVLKYNYATQSYVGWTGSYSASGSIRMTGSNVNPTISVECQNYGPSQDRVGLPGWCTGGTASNSWGTVTGGGFYSPTAVTDDGTYLYISQANGSSLAKVNASTGLFVGWIGRVNGSSPTGAAIQDGSVAGCTSTTTGNVTPGWCYGGNNYNTDQGSGTVGGKNPYNLGDGGIYSSNAITYAQAATGNYIYVGTQGMINRYNASTGQFMGWIGWVGNKTGMSNPSDLPTGTCSSASNNAVTPGWCMNGVSSNINAGQNPGAVNQPSGIYADPVHDILYVVHTDNGGTVTMYHLNSGAPYTNLTSPYAGAGPILFTNKGWAGPNAITYDSTSGFFYVADTNRVVKMDIYGNVWGWVGKVSSTSGLSGACSTLVVNADTLGWCTGGSTKIGMDEQSFNYLWAIENDGSGNLLTGQGMYFPAIKKWNISSGDYEGTLGLASTSANSWSADATSYASLYGYDDRSMYTPDAMYNDGTYLYIVERYAARIKKVNMATGAVVGWIGGITTVPTGGASGCTSANPMGASPGFCLGALFQPTSQFANLWGQMISANTDGIMDQPFGITGDGTYLYVTDNALHRIQKFNASTGAYIGWVGGIGTSPTGGASAGQGTGTATLGWSTGGMSQSGTGDGFLWNPVAITTTGGTLYVVDYNNERIASYNAASGAFLGWIGRPNGTPTQCTTSSNGQYTVSTNFAALTTSNWCKGATAQYAAGTGGHSDYGGGFAFNIPNIYGDMWAGIATDGSNLYISNPGNYRIDKFNLQGNYLGSTSSQWLNYTSTWTTNTATLGAWYNYTCWYPQGLWMDTSQTPPVLYGTGNGDCNTNGASVAWKLNANTGTMIGWQGAILPQGAPYYGSTPTGGAAGCSGASGTTPGWCQGGTSALGYTLGGFVNGFSINGDSNFVYISDENTHRVTRLPK